MELDMKYYVLKLNELIDVDNLIFALAGHKGKIMTGKELAEIILDCIVKNRW